MVRTRARCFLCKAERVVREASGVCLRSIALGGDFAGGDCSGSTEVRWVEGFDAGLGGKPRARWFERARVVSNQEFNLRTHTLSLGTSKHPSPPSTLSCGHYRCPHRGAFCPGPGVNVSVAQPVHPPTRTRTHTQTHTQMAKRKREQGSIEPDGFEPRTPPPFFGIIRDRLEEMYAVERDALREVYNAEQDALREVYNAERDALSQVYAAKKDALRDVYRAKMHDEM